MKKGLLFIMIPCFWISCAEPIPGCMDKKAFNYNPEATISDSSCIEMVNGCTVKSALNYNPKANTNDGSCVEKIEGCTLKKAMNFDPNANINDGSCLESCTSPLFDNYLYEVVVIGNQCWFAENLRTTIFTDGSPIPQGTYGRNAEVTEPRRFNYMEEADRDRPWNFTEKSWKGKVADMLETYEKYGGLYNYYSVIDSRGICPIGWHIPTNDDWIELEETVKVEANTPWTGSVLRDTISWMWDWEASDPNYWGNIGRRKSKKNLERLDKRSTKALNPDKDPFGFSIKPAGSRYGEDVGYYDVGPDGEARFWSSTDSKQQGDYWPQGYYIMVGDSPGQKLLPLVETTWKRLYDGYSCRCVRDYKPLNQ